MATMSCNRPGLALTTRIVLSLLHSGSGNGCKPLPKVRALQPIIDTAGVRSTPLVALGNSGG